MDIEIKVTKITDESLMRWACSMTIDSESSMSLDKIYKSEHSPLRTQMFTVEMKGIPTFVSTHFVRHTQGVTHFCKSLREDRCGDDTQNRWSPTNHGMFLNAQALINMSRKRLCHKSHIVTMCIMKRIKEEVERVDADLAKYMVPECIYRRSCPEDVPCGFSSTAIGGNNAI